MLPLIACHSPHWNNFLFTSCIITEFCMTFSLALNNWGQKYQKITRLQGEIKIPSAVIFFYYYYPWVHENMFISFNFFIPAPLGIVFLCCRVFEIVKVGSSTLLAELSFWHAFYLIVRVIHVANIHVTCLVYIRTFCVPIATLNQNKRSQLLYLANAQIIIIHTY